MLVTKTDWQPIYNVHVPLSHTDANIFFFLGDVEDVASRLICAESRLTVSYQTFSQLFSILL